MNLNWYKIATTSKEDTIIWECPITKMSIQAFRYNQEIQDYALYAEDGSYIDNFDSWYKANLFAKEINRKSQISKIGKLKK